ncbi:hypothetical protein SAMN05443245_6108 [Paraburkholderia fungorum]|uniref:Preprotein translocase subunit SecA n=1 Tax=Paraburkholderia fungorum TaxID=134537 RepID=A0A1H1JD42_9BURK|nr:hypothetical protein [Paraburkholderia fungorum]SDR47912.1 hypothetical protein SAMN05443245_6108 [Paraburkholderia fungorum]
MLSLHELATLLIIKDSPERIGADHAELGALRALELVDTASSDTSLPLPRITVRGQAILRAIAGVR